MKILITGITGFAGSHLTRYLSSLDGVDVVGLDIVPPNEEFAIAAGAAPPVHCCDLADAATVSMVVKRERPDGVIHLAARPQVAGAWEQATAIIEANVVCTQSLMQAVHKSAPEARILVISSSEVYGKVSPERMPINETAALKPNNPYSASKVGQEYVALQYHFAFGAPVTIARPFNHIGPRQVGNFVVPSFAKQIVEMEAGFRQPVLRVGNLESERDFTDVRDIVRGYWLILTKGEPGGAYNICSGKSWRISDILDMLLEMSQVRPEIEQIPELMRPSDTPVVRGDASRLRELTGWQPEVSLEQSLRDTLDYWRRELSLC